MLLDKEEQNKTPREYAFLVKVVLDLQHLKMLDRADSVQFKVLYALKRENGERRQSVRSAMQTIGSWSEKFNYSKLSVSSFHCFSVIFKDWS